MARNRNTRWSEDEDRALEEFYPSHGSCWVGWRDVLPGRTPKGIEKRARRLRLRKVRRSRKRAEESGDRNHYAKAEIGREPDPYEEYVLACLELGMTPTQVDSSMKWFTGTARRILTEMWARDKEEWEQ